MYTIVAVESVLLGAFSSLRLVSVIEAEGAASRFRVDSHAGSIGRKHGEGEPSGRSALVKRTGKMSRT